MTTATITTALSMVIALVTACYIDSQHDVEPIEVKTVYPDKEVKDWNFEDISNSKRLWLETIKNN